MIKFYNEEKSFYLETNNTTYIMRVNEHGHLEHVYYGSKIKRIKNINDLLPKYEFELGSSTSYDKESKGYQLNYTNLEVSTFGKGDYREPTLHLELPNGSRTIDLQYDSHEIIEDRHVKNMPQTRKDKTLVITLKDVTNKVTVFMNYSVYLNEDVIVRSLDLINQNEEPIIIDKALSFSLDMLNKGYSLTKLDGAWIRERHISEVELTKGTVRFDSKKGVSSSDHNPFFILKEKNTNEEYGKAYGFALVYSGNFEANIEINSHNYLRANMGINSFDFRYKLEKDETFVTPEVVLTFSDKGISNLSTNFHNIINNHIIPIEQQYKERPILVNNWEATYFDFNQKKLLAIAKKAKKLGIELFCLDDGWFARRNDDFSSLGDWYFNKKKLPSGVKGIADKVNKLGLGFGIWVEPEMINEDSDLYKEHPDWAIKLPNSKPSLGRNQLILDLSNPEVVTYLKETLTNLFSSANIEYVKWDMNRNFSDVYSNYLDKGSQGKFNHLFVLGLYEILEHLKETFPNILFESCASGGNRFDLGMAYYMPQTWTSDNTDAYERTLIQEGTSLLYPLSMISNHVSGDRSHQVLRHTPLESRFNVASFGVLGYELDLSKLTKFDEELIKRQVEYYKDYRHLFQYGTLKRISSVRNSNETIWQITSPDKGEAIILYFQDKALPNPSFRTIKVDGLKEGMYKVTNRVQYMNIRTTGSLVNHVLPIKLKVNGFLLNLVANRYLYKNEEMDKTISSDQLEHMELLLHHTFTGTGTNDSVMMLPDYGSRLFHIKKENEDEN